MINQRVTQLAGGAGPMRSVAISAVLLTVVLMISFFTVQADPCWGKDPLSISGSTEPIGDVTLSSTVVGTIASIRVREGMPVAKGAVILELDSKLEELEVGRRKLIWESRAELAAAEARAATLKSLSESTRELYRTTGSVSREDLEKLELEYRIAVTEKERLDAAEEREGLEYEMAKEALQKRSIRSPFQGTVIKLLLDVGESCQENQPLVQVVDTSRGIFVGNAEEWIGRTLKKGQPVDLRIKTGNESVIRKGTISFVSPVVDPASGLLEVKAEFDNVDGLVRPGISGSLILRGR
jgi:RND family efflux transporter MFP subunit